MHRPNRLSPLTRILGVITALIIVPFGTLPMRLNAATYYWDADGSTGTGRGLRRPSSREP